MTRKKLLTAFLFSALAALCAALFALRHPGFAEPAAYLLAGFAIASIALWAAIALGHIEKIADYRIKSFMAAILSVSVLVLLFDLLSGFRGSLIADFLAALAGGLLSQAYFMRRRKCTSGICQDFYYPHIGLAK